MSSTADNSYHRLMFAIRERNKYDAVFLRALDELSGKVDFSWVKSCIAMGAGSGSHEIPFIQRFLPNLRTLVAFDQDQQSVKAFQTNLQAGQLPGVEATVIQSSMRDWKGADTLVDAVLSFDVFMHVDHSDRQALYQKMFTQCLAPNGIAIVITECSNPNAGFIRIMERFGKPMKVFYDEVEKEMLTAGFSLVYSQDIWGTDDFSNPTVDLVKYLQMVVDNVASDQEMRTAIADIYRPNKQSTFHKKLGVFKK